MADDPDARYAFLVSHYGDVGMPETEADARVVDQVVPLYERGLLHDIGPTVRERAGEGRHGVLMRVALNDDHVVEEVVLDRASRDVGHRIEMAEFPGPGARRELRMFVPLTHPDSKAPDGSFGVLVALERESVQRPRLPVEMPGGVGRDRAHRALHRLLEVFAGYRLVLDVPDMPAGGPVARAWELAADLRGRSVRDTVETLAGRAHADRIMAMDGLSPEPRPLPDRIGAERILSTFEGLLRAGAPHMAGSGVSEAWTVLAEMRGQGHRETVEAVLGDADPDLVEETLRSNDLDAGSAPRP